MDVTTAIIAKIVGAISGSVLALIYMPPKTARDAAIRIIFSFGCGFLFWMYAAEKVGFNQYTFEGISASVAITALLSWPVAGAVFKILQSGNIPFKK